MKFSVVMHTCRQDNYMLPDTVLKMMVDSMHHQNYQGDFELIIVDLLWQERHQRFQELLRQISPRFPVLHIPDKSSPFKDHGLLRIATPKNTGIIFARGENVVFTDDCQVIPENALSYISEHAAAGLGSTMGYEKRLLRAREEDQVTGVDQRGNNLEIPEGESKVVLTSSIGFLGGTMSMLPMKSLLDINGWDEMFDGSRQLEDGDMIVRLTILGQEMAYENRCRIIEYECGAYGDVVNTEPIKCNGAYAQHVWSLGDRKVANQLQGEELDLVIERMYWGGCVRLRDEDKCWPHESDCTKLGDKEFLETIYKDPRLCFNLREEREKASWDNALSYLGVV
jgi:hypothetical protein